MSNLVKKEPFNCVSMSLREIAEVLGSRTDKIVQSAERLYERGVIDFLPVREGSTEELKIERRLNRVDAITLVAQNRPEYTKQIVIRLDELEAKLKNGELTQTVGTAKVPLAKLKEINSFMDEWIKLESKLKSSENFEIAIAVINTTYGVNFDCNFFTQYKRKQALEQRLQLDYTHGRIDKYEFDRMAEELDRFYQLPA